MTDTDTTTETTAETTMEVPAKALHSWSLFRTLGRFVAAGSMPSGGLPAGGGDGMELLDLPAELARRGYRSVQLCHFYLPTTDAGYLRDLTSAFAESGVELECFLVDDGDLSHPTDGDRHADWLSGWITVAEQLGAPRVRVPAGSQPPSPETLGASADRLRRLADRHDTIRVVTENWHALLPDAAAVSDLLARTEGRIGFLVDLGNWKGPGKYDELAAVAGQAETCQAKVSTEADGAINEIDYRRSLGVLQSAGYQGPLAMVHDGPDPDEWAKLEEAYAIITHVYGSARPATG